MTIQAKAYATRTLPVSTYGKVTTLEFNSLGHFAETVKATLEPRRRWASSSYSAFCTGDTPKLGFDQAIAAASTGLDSLVPASDAMLSKLEAMLPDMSLQTWRIERSIVGACPDVPSLLAGEPLTMLRRRRMLKEEAPLTVFLDLVSTQNVTNAQHMTKGAAILALVRILSTRRPVTLYAGLMCERNRSHHQATMLYFPVDTAPLDLARAAWLTAHQSACRGLMYEFCEQEAYFNGHWAWESAVHHRDRGQEVVRTVLGVEDVLCVSACQTQDPDFQVLVNDPARWLVERVKKYGHVGMEDAAA